MKHKEKIGLITQYINLIITTITIPCFAFFLWKSQNKFTDEHFSVRYGVLYRGLKTKSAFTYMFNIIFMFRRLIYIFCLIFLDYSPYLQTLVPQLMSFVLLLYNILKQPYSSDSDNRIEVFNEACIYLMFTTLHAYHHSKNILTGFSHGIGNWMIIIISLNMVVNGSIWA